MAVQPGNIGRSTYALSLIIYDARRGAADGFLAFDGILYDITRKIRLPFVGEMKLINIKFISFCVSSGRRFRNVLVRIPRRRFLRSQVVKTKRKTIRPFKLP